MDRLLATFITEARDNLEISSNCFLALEQDPTNTATLHTVFRSVHTMKGSSGLFDIIPFTNVMHEVESVLDRMRYADLVLTSDHIDTLLDSMDQVSRWLDELESSQPLNQRVDELSKRLCVELRAITGTPNSNHDKTIHVDKIGTLTELTNAPNWVSQLHHVARKTLYKELLFSDRHINIITYTPDPQCFLNGEDPIRVVQQCPGLVAFRIQSRDAWPHDKALIDPFNCNLIIQILTTADLAQINQYFRYVDNQIALLQMDRQFLASPEGMYRPTQAYQLFINDVNFSAMNLEWDKFARQVITMANIKANAPYQETICDWLVLLSHEQKPNIRIIKALLSAFNYGFFDLQDETTNSLNLATHSFQSLPDALVNLTFGYGDDLCERDHDNHANMDYKTDTVTPMDILQADSTPIQKKLRVDLARIDSLMELVGELIVAKNTLPLLAQQAQERYGLNALAKEINSQFSVINRLSEDLQAAIMQLRKMPLAIAFQRLPRLVRGLSRKLNKQVLLKIEGDETEADKNVIETLPDLLIHLVRNSIDHGLELPHERAAKNKPEQGLIILRAIPRDFQVLIEIVDDGKGIDPEVIKRKAYTKGLIDVKQLETISDQEALQLIFVPGFSTAEQISDISGRGVGMDVVKTAINQAGGSVHVQSEIDKGTMIRLSLPLSLVLNTKEVLACL